MKVILCKGRFAGPISGADETLVAYALQLKANGHDVAVAVLYPPSANDPHYERLRAAGVPVVCIASGSPVGTAVQFLKQRVPHLPAGPRKVLRRTASSVSMSYVDLCKKYFEHSRAELVHVVTPDPAAMAMIRAAHAAHIPVLYQELGTPDFLPELAFYYEQLRLVLPLCDEIVALSPHLAGRFSEKFPCACPTSILPLMVEDVPPCEAGRAESQGVAFGFAARMEYGKGPLALLEAFAQVQRRTGNVLLRMAGNGPQEEEAQRLAQSVGLNGNCTFMGIYSGPAQKSAFMRSLDVFVLPSLAEGTPNSIIEAMAHGLPVIASAVGGIPDIVSADAGILVTAGDKAALAEAMTCLATDSKRRAEMGQAARRRYEQLFSPVVVLPILTDTYQRVATRQKQEVNTMVNARSPVHPWTNEDNNRMRLSQKL